MNGFKDPRLVPIEAQLRRNLPYMDPASEFGRMITKHGAEVGIARSAVEILRRIDGIDQTLAKIQRGRM